MTRPPDPSPVGLDFPAWFAPSSIAALVSALVLGAFASSLGWSTPERLDRLLTPVGNVWLGALQLTVTPLVATQLAAAVLRDPGEDGLGRLSARALGFFVLMMLGAGALTALGAPLLLSFYDPPASALTAAGGAGAAALVPPGGTEVGGPSVEAWLLDVVTGRDLLPVILVTGAAAVVARRLPAPALGRVREAVRRGAWWVLRAVRAVLLATPVGVFALMLGVSLELGVGAAEVAVAFVALSSLWLALLTLLLYPVTAVLAGCPMGIFARALVPGQLVGLGTRSSMAALPALVDEGERTLRLGPEGTGVVLPLAATLYKVGRPAQTTFELLFLAHVFGAPVGPVSVGVFIVTVLVLNAGSVGLPNAGPAGMRSYPAFVAAGVPMGPYFFVQALGTIPDFFETVLNVTAYLGSAVALTRRRAGRTATAGRYAGAAP